MIDKKIKIALCLSGEPRSSMFCFSYIYESLINLGPQYEVDVYIHSWKNFRALPLYNPKNHLIDWIDEKSFSLNIINNLSTITSPDIVEIYNKINTSPHHFKQYQNSFLMYLSIQRSFNLITKPYDLYIRGRFDYYIPSRLDLSGVFYDILNKKYDISIPLLNINTNYNPLFDDQLSICNFEGAKHYFNLFSNIFDTIKNTNSMNPHKWLKYYLNSSSLKINLRNFEIDLTRSSRIITLYDYPYLDN